MAFEDIGDLVERARTADRDAWEALYRRAYPRLLAYAMRRLDADGARDAVSETMVRAVSGIRRYQPISGTGGFDGWLFGICRHVVLDAQRAAGRRGYALPPEEVNHVDPIEGLVSAEEAAAVRKAFGRLSDGDRELLELRVVGGLSAEETAEALGRRPGAVRMAQSRALGRLRRLLVEDEGASA
ncbi:MAG: sigma-70 family RNA polymerase sigma factor [Acidimicrobiia bacterium]|nr:sigma-70 family RNA polymerase sigma factor [Acidimicrobiia bacterium]